MKNVDASIRARWSVFKEKVDKADHQIDTCKSALAFAFNEGDLCNS